MHFPVLRSLTALHVLLLLSVHPVLMDMLPQQTTPHVIRSVRSEDALSVHRPVLLPASHVQQDMDPTLMETTRNALKIVEKEK